MNFDHEYHKQLAQLEAQHLRVQLQALAHFRVHYHMLLLALRYRVWKEVWGQIPRLMLAIPGSLTGKAPRGNVGSTKMGIFEVKKER